MSNQVILKPSRPTVTIKPTGVLVVNAGPGPQGGKGDKGDAGTTTWAGITDKPVAFPPAAHVHTPIPAHYARDVAWSLKGRTVAADRLTLLTPYDLLVNISGTSYRLAGQVEINLSLAASWDSVATDYTVAANRAGHDFYVYACQSGGAAPLIVLSGNSTVPVGYTAITSRKIGGFHCLCVAVGTIATHPLTDFLAGDILPESIWDLSFRPVCSPEGMAYDLKSGIWVDLYLQSGVAGAATSVNGATIADTRTWLDVVDDMGAVGKRLLTDTEFQLAATGSNEKTNITGSVDPVTTGGHVDTAGRRMISNIGLEDACGVMWQWLQDQTYRYDPDGSMNDATVGATVYHAAAPGGNQVYLKYSSDNTLTLCCNMATALADKVVAFGGYKLIIKHDPNAAVGGAPVYFKDNATQPGRFLVNNAVAGLTAYVPTNHPSYLLQATHDANAAVNGRALYYDDGADNRLEANNIGAANATGNLAVIGSGTVWNYYVLPGNKGSIYKQGNYGDAKLAAGGYWNLGSICGSRSRVASYYRWYASSAFGARGCARSL